MEIFGIIIIVAFIAIVSRLVAGSFDADRVAGYILEKGGELVDRSWDPLGPGWFGEKDSRIYQIVYRDSAGNLHRAHVKTSMMSGVYLTNDQIIEKAPQRESGRSLSLKEENARLKEKIRELERGDGG